MKSYPFVRVLSLFLPVRASATLLSGALISEVGFETAVVCCGNGEFGCELCDETLFNFATPLSCRFCSSEFWTFVSGDAMLCSRVFSTGACFLLSSTKDLLSFMEGQSFVRKMASCNDAIVCADATRFAFSFAKWADGRWVELILESA